MQLTRLKLNQRARNDPRFKAKWRTAQRVKLRRDPICQLRVRCNGAAASHVAPILAESMSGSAFDLDRLQSTCPACNQWKLMTSYLRVHV